MSDPRPPFPSKPLRAAIVRFCEGYLGHRDDAEDAAQEVFSRALAAKTAPENPGAYLRKIARNHCLNVLRSRRRRRDGERMETEAPFAASLAGPLTLLAGKECRADVQKALAALTDEQREVLWLRYGEDLSRSEIAAILGVAESTVKSRLEEAVKKVPGTV